MRADHELDLVNHQASENRSAVNCVVPLVVQCRRFWHAYQQREKWERARAPMCNWPKVLPAPMKLPRCAVPVGYWIIWSGLRGG